MERKKDEPSIIIKKDVKRTRIVKILQNRTEFVLISLIEEVYYELN